MEKEIKLEAQFQTQLGKIIKADITIVKGWCFTKFSDPSYCKKLFDAEKRSGNKNIYYHMENNTIAQEYKDMNSLDITKIISKELGACLKR